MAYVIAVAGKGGVGKTTLCGFLIKYLCNKKKGPVLAVDADANSNLNEVLGVEVETTLGDIREEVENSETGGKSPIPPTMSKQDYMNFRLSGALVEEDDYDMLVMGRTQGAGCYCYVNGLLEHELAKLVDNYEYMVVDNEAGMEHISRGILPKVDLILLVSDCSRRGIQAVGRIDRLARELNLGAKDIKLLVNRAPHGELNEGVKEEIEKQHLDLLGVLPQDENVYEYDCEGKPTSELGEDDALRQAFCRVLDTLPLE